MRFVAESGEFFFHVKIDGKVRRHSIALEMSGVRIGDVPTLEYPVGFVRFDPLSVTSQEGWDKLLIDSVFRRLGSPVQIVFDLSSVGEMQGRLVGAQSQAKGQVLGTIQFDDRRTDVVFDAVFSRTELGVIEVEAVPFKINIEDFKMDLFLDSFKRKAGIRKIDPMVEVEGSLTLKEFTGEQLPSFIRTPVVVMTVDEMRQKIDDEVDNAEARYDAAWRQGIEEFHLERSTPQAMDKAEELRNKLFKRNRQAAPLPPRE